jgi:hypothetical protein
MIGWTLSEPVRQLHSLWSGVLSFFFLCLMLSYANSDRYSMLTIQMVKVGCSSEFTEAFGVQNNWVSVLRMVVPILSCTS